MASWSVLAAVDGLLLRGCVVACETDRSAQAKGVEYLTRFVHTLLHQQGASLHSGIARHAADQVEDCCKRGKGYSLAAVRVPKQVRVPKIILVGIFSRGRLCAGGCTVESAR